MEKYQLNKESRQESTAFPAAVSVSIDAVCSSKGYRNLLPEPAADAASAILSQVNALPPALSVANAATTTTDSVCVVPGQF